MAIALIGFGSNVGNRLDFCDRTLTLLSLLPHSRLDAVSSLYETEPVDDGAAPGPEWFLNGVAQLETDITPKSLLEVSQEIERALGRDLDHREGHGHSTWTSCSMTIASSRNQAFSFLTPGSTSAVSSLCPWSKSLRTGCTPSCTAP